MQCESGNMLHCIDYYSVLLLFVRPPAVPSKLINVIACECVHYTTTIPLTYQYTTITARVLLLVHLQYHTHSPHPHTFRYLSQIHICRHSMRKGPTEKEKVQAKGEQVRIECRDNLWGEWG